MWADCGSTQGNRRGPKVRKGGNRDVDGDGGAANTSLTVTVTSFRRKLWTGDGSPDGFVQNVFARSCDVLVQEVDHDRMVLYLEPRRSPKCLPRVILAPQRR